MYVFGLPPDFGIMSIDKLQGWRQSIIACAYMNVSWLQLFSLRSKPEATGVVNIDMSR